MSRLVFTGIVFLLVLSVNTSAFSGEEGGNENSAAKIHAEVQELCAAPFTGTIGEYPAHAEQLGEKILARVDPALNESNLSDEEKNLLVKIKELGLTFRYGFNDAEHEKEYEKFLGEVQDYALYRKWIDKKFSKISFTFANGNREEDAEEISRFLEQWAPLINKYYDDEKRISNEQLPSIVVSYAEINDPDGSRGLVRSSVEKLRPILEADAKRKQYDLLRFCAQGALNSLRRLDTVGKPVDFSPVDFFGRRLDWNALEGKVVLVVAAPGAWDLEKIEPLKTLHAELKEPGLEVVLFGAMDRETAERQFLSDGETWTLTTRYGRDEAGKEFDYVESLGTFYPGFLVDREGILVCMRSDGISPELVGKLLPYFPEQQDRITQAVGKLRTVEEENQRKSEEYLEKVVDKNEEMPESLKALGKFRGKIDGYFAPEQELALLELILGSEDLPPKQRDSFLRSKVDALGEIARKRMEKDPKLPPEIAYRDMDVLADELLETCDPAFLHSLLFAKQSVLFQMREYLKTMESGQEQYAEEITRRFLDIHKRAPESFYENSSVFVMFFDDALEEVDSRDSTQLSKSFLERVIPVFAASSDPKYQWKARQMEGQLRRSSLLGREMEFETILLDGSKINVKDFRGKIVLVNFWNTQCGPCLREFPHMKTLYEKYKPLGYEMIAYSCGDDFESLTDFVQKHDYPWLMGSLLMSQEKGLVDYNSYYGIKGVPTTMILDREGIVRFMIVGSDDEKLSEEIERIFAEFPPQPEA